MKQIHVQRIERVQEKMARAGMEQLIVSDPASLWYLTGETLDPGERLTVLIIDCGGSLRWVKNALFTLASEDIPVLSFQDGEDGIRTVAEDMMPGVIGVDGSWPSRFLLALQAACPRTYVNGSGAIDRVRAVKDEEEQRLMRESSAVNDRCMAALARWLHAGVTEAEAADHLRQLYKEEGCEDVSFAPIVAFGPHGAGPHHTVSDAVLTEGTVVLLDIGGKKDRYCSDMTRTYFFGDVPDKVREIHRIVCEACETAEALVRPGVPLAELDRAARTVIEKAGYGPQFYHRLGHFIGQTDHEAGEVSASSPLIAEPGMIFSIEPGIYLTGEFGVRIEDLVLVTETGAERLNHLPHSPYIHDIGGTAHE